MPDKIHRTANAALLLMLLLTPASAAGRAHPWNLQLTALGLKVMPVYDKRIYAGATADILRVRLSYDRFSLGATALRFNALYFSVPSLHAGYTFFRHDAPHGAFRSMRPEAYVELEAIPPGSDMDGGNYPWAGRLAACCDADFYAVGLTSEVGVLAINRHFFAEASLGIRLLANFAF